MPGIKRGNDGGEATPMREVLSPLALGDEQALAQAEG